MTKKHFREHWEPAFISYSDSELYAIHIWIDQMKTSNQWHGYVGRVWDEYLAQHDKQAEQLAEDTQPQDGQSVH